MLILQMEPKIHRAAYWGFRDRKLNNYYQLRKHCPSTNILPANPILFVVRAQTSSPILLITH